MARRWQRVLKRYPELRSLVEEAARDGATHVEYVGPAIGFYRVGQDKIERCFAEYSPSAKRFTWIWRPPDWRESGHLPQGAVPIEEFLPGRWRF